MADTGNVNAARRNIRCDKDLDLAIAERLQCSGALALRFVAVDRGGLNACAGKPTYDTVSAMLGAGEDQCPVNFLALQFKRQQGLLFALLDKGHKLFDTLCRGCRGGDRNTHRIVEEAIAQLSNRLWHGCGKEQCLTLLWQQLVNTL